MVATDERTELAAKREFAELLKATLAVYGKDSSKSVIRLYWNAVGSFDIGLIRQALSQWITDPDQGRYAPKPADIIRNIQRLTGRPSWVSANEAWAIALPAQDEANTLIWTAEIAQAWRVAEPIFSDGDRVGARMAFIAAYDRLVATAQSSGVLPQWTLRDIYPRPSACHRQRWTEENGMECWQKFRHLPGYCWIRKNNGKRRNGTNGRNDEHKQTRN
ncbi:hypothetical protein [Pectobacterium parvum]|uniref:Uncharacterized protein n=1 Tax=Pectobacterium parvum TaxID=2778550 RepID=A0ABW8FWE6_9GAMM